MSQRGEALVTEEARPCNGTELLVVNCLGLWNPEGVHHLHANEHTGFFVHGFKSYHTGRSQDLQEEIAKAEAGEIAKVKNYTKEKIAEIRRELNEMLRFNANAPELEVLDRDEFTIDVKEREQIEKEGCRTADEMRAQSKKQNQVNELLTHRIKLKTQDSMET